MKVQVINSTKNDTFSEEVLYKLYILKKHHRAMDDIAKGNLHTTQEVINALKKL